MNAPDVRRLLARMRKLGAEAEDVELVLGLATEIDRLQRRCTSMRLVFTRIESDAGDWADGSDL